MKPVIPEKLLRLMSPEDRRKLIAVMPSLEATNERELQKQIVNYLRLQGIEALWFRTDKRTTANVGWPDLTFAAKGIPCLWEVKFEKGKLSLEQFRMQNRLTANGWRYRVITSLQQARDELRELGVLVGGK